MSFKLCFSEQIIHFYTQNQQISIFLTFIIVFNFIIREFKITTYLLINLSLRALVFKY
jgi:hypothetical protein